MPLLLLLLSIFVELTDFELTFGKNAKQNQTGTKINMVTATNASASLVISFITWL